MSRPAADPYHHGDLRAACLNAALALLEEEGEAALSIRAVARRAGVSPNAPYRHYRDKEALLAAVATRGFRDLRQYMAEADASAVPGDEFIALGQSYVRYLLEHPGLSKMMFEHPCSSSDPDTSAAAAEVTAVLAARVATLVPDGGRQQSFAIGSWSLVHGLAVLLLNGKIPAEDSEQVDDLVRKVVSTALAPNVPIASA